MACIGGEIKRLRQPAAPARDALAGADNEENEIMVSVRIEEAQARLPELIEGLHAGEEVLITRGTEPVAKLIATTAEGMPRKPGLLRDQILYMAEDFDAPLEDFKEYMG
jgi:antitoxin (DNA-binding transcriptional repressor) of toxin-antitoxin stability system